MSEPVVCYRLERVVLDENVNGLVTAAIWSCALCGGIIDGMGGPGNGEICESCAKAIKDGRAGRLVRGAMDTMRLTKQFLWGRRD